MPGNEKEAVASSFTVGLPRSGTNFFQSVLRSVTTQSAESIYSGKAAKNLKSHALSPSYLDWEASFFGISKTENPLHWLLVRDPRDIVISFYDFVLARKNLDIEQDEFLTIDYFFALSYNGSAKADARCEFLQPLTIENAFEAFAKNWLAARTEGTSRVNLVRYETLADPQKLPLELQSLGLFEGCDNHANMEATAQSLSQTLVSQYSISPYRRRGQPFCHRFEETRSHYRTLIEETEKRLGGVIEILGYR